MPRSMKSKKKNKVVKSFKKTKSKKKGHTHAPKENNFKKIKDAFLVCEKLDIEQKIVIIVLFVSRIRKN